MSKLKLTSYLILVIFILLLGKISFAEQDSWLDNANKQLATWQKEFNKWRKKPPSLEILIERQNAVSDIRQQAANCIETAKVDLEETNKKLSAFGDEQPDEASKVKKFRQELTQDKKRIADHSALCRVVNLASRELIDELKNLRSELVSRTLTHREKTIWQTTLELLNTTSWLKTSFTDFKLWPAWLIGLISLVMLYPLTSYLSRLLGRYFPATEKPQRTERILGMLAKRLPWIAVLSSLVLFTYFGNNNLFSALLLALLLSLIIAPLLEVTLCEDATNCQNGLPARILLDLVLVGLLLASVGIDSILQPLAFDVLYGGYLFLILSTSIWLTLKTLKQQPFAFLRTLSLPLIIALSSGPGAYWLGYKALSDLLITGVYGSLAGLIAILSTYSGFNLLLHHLQSPHNAIGKQLRSVLGYQDEENISSFGVMRVSIAIAMAALFIYWLLLTWNVPTADIGTLVTYFTEGFEIGSATVVPSKIIGALIALFALFAFAGWLRRKLGEHWLKKTSLDTGAQQSIVSLTTYTIIGLGILLALNMSGVELQSLAIVAGALSVGIGFGLQNIVNNFVSGLILLFERPVKPGDWVVVGGTEGYIKKISIRYTQIQTFDRSDVLVPNSELISSPVTNWMLRDKLGRVIVKVGVAYGTDTRKVNEILNHIAREHPFVLTKDSRVSAPRVFFMGFGDSALDFELRCFIKDVDYKLSVRSDLLFAIDDAFRKENIEIPFPQQVVHHANAMPPSISNEPIKPNKDSQSQPE